eukprot:GHVN01082154.1.p1 GENE.GHVN01082154.1~~GHVN01082154.1.p1  ORF type:complete len:357 (+),score=59.67 GHVN01082154.1:697-1767(+)
MLPDDSKEDPASFLDLYSLTYAPLSGDTLLEDVGELSPSDFNAEMAIEELNYVKSFASFGLSEFEGLLTRVKESGDEQTLRAALVCFSQYLKRCQSLLGTLSDVALEAASPQEEALSTLNEFEQSVKEGNLTDHVTIRALVNLTPNMKWESPSLAQVQRDKGKVGFKDNIVVFGGAQAKGEEPLKETANTCKRTQRRHPTGFARFSFKPEDLEDSDDGGSTGVSRSRVDSDDQRSVGSTAGNQSMPRSTDGTDDDEMLAFRQADRAGSVGFSNEATKEIQDQEADPNWADETRHEKRFSRIRNRVPTGHPTIMKAASDELSGLLEDYENQLTGMGDDDATLANTSLNRGAEEGGAK